MYVSFIRATNSPQPWEVQEKAVQPEAGRTRGVVTVRTGLGKEGWRWKVTDFIRGRGQGERTYRVQVCVE